jgi:hypothetical protein
MSELKTFKQWSNAGYRIYKGSHHVARNENNEPLFSAEQVYMPSDSYEDFDLEEDADFAQAFNLPWGDGS